MPCRSLSFQGVNVVAIPTDLSHIRGETDFCNVLRRSGVAANPAARKK